MTIEATILSYNNEAKLLCWLQAIYRQTKLPDAIHIVATGDAFKSRLCCDWLKHFVSKGISTRITLASNESWYERRRNFFNTNCSYIIGFDDDCSPASNLVEAYANNPMSSCLPLIEFIPDLKPWKKTQQQTEEKVINPGTIIQAVKVWCGLLLRSDVGKALEPHLKKHADSFPSDTKLSDGAPNNERGIWEDWLAFHALKPGLNPKALCYVYDTPTEVKEEYVNMLCWDLSCKVKENGLAINL